MAHKLPGWQVKLREKMAVAKVAGNLTLVESIFLLIKSKIADMKRSGGGSGVPEHVIDQLADVLFRARESLTPREFEDVYRRLGYVPGYFRRIGVKKTPLFLKKVFEAYGLTWTGEKESRPMRQPRTQEEVLDSTVILANSGKRVRMGDITYKPFPPSRATSLRR